MRKHNHRRAQSRCAQDADGGAQGAVRQIIAAQDGLEGLSLDPRASGGKGIGDHRLHRESCRNVTNRVTLMRIGRYDQDPAGVEHVSPRSEAITTAREEAVRKSDYTLRRE